MCAMWVGLSRKRAQPLSAPAAGSSVFNSTLPGPVPMVAFCLQCSRNTSYPCVCAEEFHPEGAEEFHVEGQEQFLLQH